MHSVYVQYLEECISSYHEDKEWGSWEEENCFSIKGVSLSSSKDLNSSCSEELVPCSTEVTVGQEVFVLWISYTTGDSFGHASGKGEIFWVFSDKKTAAEAKNKVYRQVKNHDIKLTLEDGSVIKLSNPVQGYFEGLDSVVVDSFIVKS
jgi:hypothetical protein